MAGHSKFKNIQHRKGAQDKKRAKIFARLTKEIMVAAKMGLPDPDANPRLRTAILAARAQNMPKDNIERAIKKSSDDGDTVYEEVRYEGFGPAGIGIIVETLSSTLSALTRKPYLKRPLRPVRKMWTVLTPAMKLSARSRNCIISSMLCKTVWVSRAQPILSGGRKMILP